MVFKFAQNFAVASLFWLAIILSKNPLLASSEISEKTKDELFVLIEEYILKNPEIILEAFRKLENKQLAEKKIREKQIINENIKQLFHSNGEILNPEENIIIVAFVDFNCAYCKKSDYEIRKILKLHKDIHYIIKHFPILGESSMLAARASISIRLAEDFNVYLKFYNDLMTSKSKLSLTEIEKIAVNSGANTDIMIRTLYTNKVDEIIKANYKIGEMLGIAGTPTFIINGEIYRGHLEGYEIEEIIKNYRKKIQKKQS